MAKITIQCKDVSRIQFVGHLNQAGIGEVGWGVAIFLQKLLDLHN